MIILETFQILTRNSLYKQKYKNININNLNYSTYLKDIINRRVCFKWRITSNQLDEGIYLPRSLQNLKIYL